MQFSKKKCDLYCEFSKHKRTIIIVSAVILGLLTIYFVWTRFCDGKDRSLRDEFEYDRKRKERARRHDMEEKERPLSEEEKYRRRMKYGKEANQNNMEQMKAHSENKKKHKS